MKGSPAERQETSPARPYGDQPGTRTHNRGCSQLSGHWASHSHSFFFFFLILNFNKLKFKEVLLKFNLKWYPFQIEGDFKEVATFAFGSSFFF